MERERLEDHAAFFRSGLDAFRAQHNITAEVAPATEAAAAAEGVAAAGESADAAAADAGSQQEEPEQVVVFEAPRRRATMLPPNQLKGEWKPLVDRVAWKLHHNRLRSAANSA